MHLLIIIIIIIIIIIENLINLKLVKHTTSNKSKLIKYQIKQKNNTI